MAGPPAVDPPAVDPPAVDPPAVDPPAGDPPAGDPVYDVVAAFAAGLAEHGVTDVVISPGSRSTPLAVTLHAQPALRTWIQLDERSAGFFALGQARRTGRPSVLVCTSGTAAANYLPAVVEAHHSGVPMIVCTADRPPELRNWGAGQTIDQVGIYGSTTRWAADLPVAGEWTPGQARIAAHRAVASATSMHPGPVHLNWPLREPLEPLGDVPIVEPDPAAVVGRSSDHVSALFERGFSDLAGEERGVIIVGPDAGPGLRRQQEVVAAALRLGARTGWPVLGEPISGVRRSGDAGGGLRVANAEHLLMHPVLAAELAPDVVIRVGGSPTAKPVRLWLERHRPEKLVLIDPAERWNDASFTVTHHVAEDPAMALDTICAGALSRTDSGWADRWAGLDLAAAGAIAVEVDDGPLLSAMVVRTLAESVPAGTLVMVSNSMPVRDLDAFVPVEGPAIDFVGNRGASGIDGITSTALGLASQHEGPVVLFTGDLALLHDLGALVGAARIDLHLTVVCVDNDGGAIFSMLPIAARGDEVDFEMLFRTPHGLDLRAFDGIGGVVVAEVTTAAALADALAAGTTSAQPGIDLIIVPVDRDADLAQHRAVGAAVGAAVG